MSCGRVRTLVLQLPFMLVLEQPLNSAAVAEMARTERIAASFMMKSGLSLEKFGFVDLRSR